MEPIALQESNSLQNIPTFQEPPQSSLNNPLLAFYDPAICTVRKTEMQHSDIVRRQEIRAALGGRPLTKKEIKNLLAR